MQARSLAHLGLALALVGTAGTADAVTLPPNINSATVLPISGSTATDRVLSDVFLDSTSGLAQDNAYAADADVTEVFTTASEFADSAPGNSVTYQNYAIAFKARVATGGLTVGQTYMAVKYSGGLPSGIIGVADGTPVANEAGGNWVDPIACKASVTPTNRGGTGGIVKYKLYLCSQTVGAPGVVPKAGITDVEAVLIPGLTATHRARLTQTKTVGVVFAPSVNQNFFIALQQAQGIGAPCVLDGTRAHATASCLPSLTSAQLRGLYMGSLADSSYFTDNNGNVIAAPSSGDTTIYICRRGANSGTQISFQTYFLRQGCGTAGQLSPLQFAPGDTPDGRTWSPTDINVPVFAGATTRDVKECLAAHNSHGDYAIGMLSTENEFDDTTELHRFIKVDGVAPSLENVVAGKYSFFTENRIQRPNNVGGSPNTLPPAQTALLSAVQSTLADPAFVRNAIVTFPHGLGGILAIPTGLRPPPSAPYTSAKILTTPVNSQVRSNGLGGTSNSCTPPTIFEFITAATKTDASN